MRSSFPLQIPSSLKNGMHRSILLLFTLVKGFEKASLWYRFITFWTIRTNYEKVPYIGVFLKFFLDSLKLERPWAFTFLGSLNPRDRNIDYTFMSFSESLNNAKKRPMKHSSFSFKLHKNERTEKEWGFYAHILHAAVHWVIFKLGTCFASMSNGWVIHCLWVMIIPIESMLRRLVTLTIIHGVWCLFHRVNVVESYYLTCQ